MLLRALYGEEQGQLYDMARKFAYRMLDLAYKELHPDDYVSLDDACESEFGRGDMDYHGYLKTMAGGLDGDSDAIVSRAIEHIGHLDWKRLTEQAPVLRHPALRVQQTIDLASYLLRHSLSWPLDPEGDLEVLW